jgi:hypothetical protein
MSLIKTISFLYDQTGRPRPAAALNTDPPSVENLQLLTTGCYKNLNKGLKLFPRLRLKEVAPAGQPECRDMSGKCQKMPGRLFLVLVVVLVLVIEK